ncbi:MAG: hypothetical protein ABIR56_09165 [Polaromonas sp.]
MTHPQKKLAASHRAFSVFTLADALFSFVVSSDNRATSGRNSTAPGKWHLSDDGRYCIVIEWKTVETEEWCRLVIKTADGYYTAKSDKTGAEKVYKLDISGK